ncbi:MAG: exodeoxyribonuclease VII small subunit [Bacilli bacterium]|jgi:exodeoxyribonuclease VII small subunit|nr:exodeoxyribonuclease VII small subunit [Bacilli bacterium]
MKEMSFEEELEKLEKIVKELESGDVNLDDAIDKYSEAMKMAKNCSDKIKKAESLVSKVLKDNKLEDFKIEES